MRPLVLLVLLSLTACGERADRLVASDQIIGDAIPASLTSAPGNVEHGEMEFISRDGAHCVLCHVVDGLDAEFQGNVGPDLSLVGDRFTSGQIRLRIVDYQIVQPGTLMPSYYRTHDLYQVGDEFTDAPVLSAQDVEDLVAYLSALRTNEDEE